MLVTGRVADNTLQQLMLFVIGLLALSVSMPFERLSFIPALSITFVIAQDHLLDRLPHPPAVPRAGLLVGRLHEPVHVRRRLLAVAALS